MKTLKRAQKKIMKLIDLYFNLTADFNSFSVEAPEFEAKELIKHFTSLDETGFIINRNTTVSDEVLSMIEASRERRRAGEPLQYIIGKWDFLCNTFKVGEGVLIPRPETEILCEYVINSIKDTDNPVVYDLCSGSGCIGLSIKHVIPCADVYCIEKSKKAFEYLAENNRTVTDNKACILNADIFDTEGFNTLPKADVIVSNPPYIRTDELSGLQREVQFEPSMALDGGEDGLIFYRHIIESWKDRLKNNGIFAFECGEDQANDISRILSENGFMPEIFKDFNNIERIVTGRRAL